jgi:hypothetical protein
MPTQLNLIELYSSDPPDFGATQTLDMTQPAYANTLAEYRTQHNGALVGILRDIANSSINKDEFYNRTIFNHLSLVLMSGLTPDPTDWTQQYRAILALIKINTSASRFSGIATMPIIDSYVLSLPDVLSLSDGLVLLVYFPSVNTTTSPTINVSNLGTKQIKNCFGGDLMMGELTANKWHWIVYQSGVFRCVNERFVDWHDINFPLIKGFFGDPAGQSYSSAKAKIKNIGKTTSVEIRAERLSATSVGSGQYSINILDMVPNLNINAYPNNAGLQTQMKVGTFEIDRISDTTQTVCGNVWLNKSTGFIYFMIKGYNVWTTGSFGASGDWSSTLFPLTSGGDINIQIKLELITD